MAATTARRAADVASQEGSTPCPERGGEAVAGANQSFAGRARGPRRAGEGAVGSGGGPFVQRGGGAGGSAGRRHGSRVGGALQPRGAQCAGARPGRRASAAVWRGGAGAHPGRVSAGARPRAGRHRRLVTRDAAAGVALGGGRAAGGGGLPARSAAGGVLGVSVDTIARVLPDSGLSWQASRSWCDPGTVLRKRKAGVVAV